MTDDVLHFTGIDGSTGGYLHPPLTLKQAAGAAEPSGKAHASDLELRQTKKEPSLAVIRQERADDLGHAGWALVIPAGLSASIREALEPLCGRRREQAGDRFKVMQVRPNETKAEFLARNSMGPGTADPRKVPYYLLIVGPPDRISYRFQYELDVQYAVGRVSFEGPEDYRSYAETVVRAEDRAADDERSVRLFGPSHPSDRATELSRTQLVDPLRTDLVREVEGWAVDAVTGADATKDVLTSLLWGDDAPALVVTAGHGLGFPPEHRLRHDAQGALVCADWTGPPAKDEEVDPDAYVAASDLPDGAPVRTQVVFAFACYGAGTPDQDDFVHRDNGRASVVAAGDAFVARLPERMLAHPAGGALAFIGHVDRAWGYSFVWPEAGAHTQTFLSMLVAITDGKRVGNAMEYVNARAAEISSQLTTDLYDRNQYHKRIDPLELSGLWTANNDARSYVIVGDPAVRVTGG